MDKSESERLFCIWKLMEEIAFRPTRDKIVGWLYCYFQFLVNFWQVPDYPLDKFAPNHQKVVASVNYSPLRLKYSLQLELSLNKHAIHIEFDQCSLQFGYDVNFLMS
jgi:hypothetical protein